MRLLLLTLFAGSVLGAPGKAGSKGPAINCTAVLGTFHTDRDACLTPLGLLEWTVFPPPTTPAPPTPPTTSAPVTSAPVTSAPTGTAAPVTGAPVTGAPVTGAPTGTAAPVTGAPSATPAPPTPTPAMAACAPAGPCRSFINGVDMWRGQIEWCLREAAEAEANEDVAAQIASELAIATQLVNKGCSKNEMGDLCADGAFDALKEADPPCPETQDTVDGWVESYGCCVASYAELSMARAELIEATPCEGEFEIGKACKAPKWKLPKKAASKAGGLAKKGKIAGAVIGGVAGLGVIGFALRKRRAKLAAKASPQKATGQVAMVSVPVAV